MILNKLFPYESQNGILRYIQKKAGSKYFTNVNISTDYAIATEAKLAFDFNDKTYWITNNNAHNGNYLLFCLSNHTVKITGYEITASTYNASGTPFKWGFSAGNNTNNEKIEEYKMNPGEKHYVPYSKEGFFNCFRYINRGYISLDKENNVGPGYRSRVAQIEIFGYLCFGKCRITSIKQQQTKIRILSFISLVYS